MIKIIFAFAISLVGFVSIMTSTNYSSLNNSFEIFNYSLPKQWVVTDIEGESVAPIFDSKKVEDTAIAHFKSNIKGHLNKFILGFYYFHEDTLEETTDRYATGVRVSLKADLPFNVKFSKAAIYVVSKVVE